MVDTLSAQTGIGLDKAREILIAKAWNFTQALAEVKETERREMLVLKFMQEFPDV